jgi:RimJ/RimL family protein N-acetyltransferase
LVSEITTPRLRLRLWRSEDATPYAAMNADPRMREHFPGVLTRAESDASVERIRAHFATHGFGLWAVEERGAAGFIGFTGLMCPSVDLPCGKCVEIGWRIAFEHWGKGYATEAARAALQVGFEKVGLDEIVSFTVAGNAGSRRVMEKIGMLHDPADEFDHPNFEAGHPLRAHVLYRLRRANWERSAAR